MAIRPFAATLNHLLAQNEGALARLARFAGKTVRLDITPFCWACTILPDGTVRSADSGASADATCVVAPSLLPRLALRDEKAYADILAEGDAALLAEIFSLARSLRWDAPKDLSRLTGDAIAGRLVRAAQDVRQQLRHAATNLSKAAASYCTEEHPLLAKTHDTAEFRLQTGRLRDDLARLEQRINQLAT